MEDESSWWARFDACEDSSQALMNMTYSEGRPERMDALDSIFERLREKLLEECQAETRAWRKESTCGFHPRLCRAAAYAERKLMHLLAALEWKAAGLSIRLKAVLEVPKA